MYCIDDATSKEGQEGFDSDVSGHQVLVDSVWKGFT